MKRDEMAPIAEKELCKGRTERGLWVQVKEGAVGSGEIQTLGFSAGCPRDLAHLHHFGALAKRAGMAAGLCWRRAFFLGLVQD